MSALALNAPLEADALDALVSRFRDSWCGCVSEPPLATRARARWVGGRLDFRLPAALEATAPAEARGLARDGVRLLVTQGPDAPVSHTCVRSLHRFLHPGDLLVVNTSGTLNAAVPVVGRRDLRIHLSQELTDGRWSVELRRVHADGVTEPHLGASAGARFALPGGAALTLDAPLAPDAPRRRLWIARLTLDDTRTVADYLARHGHPIRYGYVPREWPAGAYQTTFALEPGSAEMPSAGRPLTSEVFQRLRARGVGIAPIVLHTGVASPEDDEPPYAERFRVSHETARLVNEAREAGRRVIAVGTTVVRALESASDEAGHVRARESWADLVITPSRGVRVVDGLLTGFHEPRASHLWMLEAIAGREHLAHAYDEALRHGYLWHEFGDVHLILH